MRPDIDRITGNIDWNISKNRNTTRSAITSECTPLTVKEELYRDPLLPCLFELSLYMR